MAALRTLLGELYHGQSPRARAGRYAIMAIDIASILFFVVTTFLEYERWILVVDLAIAAFVLADLIARMILAPVRIQFFARISTLVDLVVVVSLLAPAFTESFLFLRVLRAMRLFRSYHVLRELRESFKFFARNEEIIQSVINLTVFIFVVTAVVYVLQVRINPGINTYFDALYFTVTTLTTTGFGDITLVGDSGHLLAVCIMVVGISLFLRLLQSIFRPAKVRYQCAACGLTRHDADAVHCKHCGALLNITTEGVG